MTFIALMFAEIIIRITMFLIFWLLIGMQLVVIALGVRKTELFILKTNFLKPFFLLL